MPTKITPTLACRINWISRTPAFGSDAYEDHTRRLEYRGAHTFLEHQLSLMSDAALSTRNDRAKSINSRQIARLAVSDRVGMIAMTLSGLEDRDAAIEALLAVARREMLVLAVAVGAI